MITIVMPVYNAKEYIDDAIGSLINQTLDFKNNVKLYLVDDHSTDESYDICKEYAKQYPDNIVAIQTQENGGPSKARNTALAMVENKKEQTVLFMDSDDRLDEHALMTIQNYMDTHPDIEIMAMELFYFGAKEGAIKNNARFSVGDVIDIKKDYANPQFYIGGTVFRGKALAHLKFDENMQFFEDALACSKAILRAGKYGLIKDAVYYYRKNENTNSVVDKVWYKKERYIPLIKKGYLRLFWYSIQRYGRIIPYIQYLVAYHLRLVLLSKNNQVMMQVLSEKEIDQYRKWIKFLLMFIPEEVILQMYTASVIMEWMLSVKFGKKIRFERNFRDQDCFVEYNGRTLFRLSDWDVRVFRMDGMELVGRYTPTAYRMNKGDYLYIEKDGETIPCTVRKSKKEHYIFGVKMMDFRYSGFRVIPPKEWDKFRFWLHTSKGDVRLQEFDMLAFLNKQNQTSNNRETTND